MATHPKLGLRSEPAPRMTDREALRELLNETDVLGYDPDNQPWLLVRTTPQLLEYLEQMDGPVEDAEESDAGELDDVDALDVNDWSLIQPDGTELITRALPSEDDEDSDADEPNGDVELDPCDAGEPADYSKLLAPNDPEWGRAAQDGTLVNQYMLHERLVPMCRPAKAYGNMSRPSVKRKEAVRIGRWLKAQRKASRQ